MVDDTLVVSGGAGGITADYEDMLTRARVLESLATAVLERVPQVAAVAVDVDVVASTVLSPVTAATVQAQVSAATVGPHGLAAAAAQLSATAASLRVSVSAYQAVDAAQARLEGWAVAAGAFPALLLGPAGPVVDEVVEELLDGDPMGAVYALSGYGPALMDNLYDNPWIVDGVIKDAPALLRVLSWPVTLAFGPGPVIGLGLWTRYAEQSPFPPGSLEEATADIVAIGRLFGLFEDGSPYVRPDVGVLEDTCGVIGWRSPDDDEFGVVSPTSVEDLFGGVASLGREPGTVRVFSVTGQDGVRRWVVQIPGTQEWGPTAGENPVDLTTNLRLMAGQDTAQNEAIRDAMRQAGIPPGEEVMLAGHSQGGITAASLASDPATRAEFRITQVVTAGSPIARFDIPDDVNVLSIEHAQDAVPRLDGEPNPDRVNWTTVVRDPTGYDRGPTKGPVDSTGESHYGDVYAATGGLIDDSTDPGLVVAREGLEPFLAGDGDTVVYQDYDMTRRTP